jgi:hypothetical protein
VIRRALVAAVGLAAGCDEPTIESERGEFAVVFPGLQAEPHDVWRAPHRVVAGALLCPRVTCDACVAADSCDLVEVTAAGAVVADGGGCFAADGAGEVVWRASAPCDAEDRAVMTVVPVEGVAAEVVLWPDRRAETGGVRVVGAGFDAELAAPLRVVEESRVRLAVRLFARGDGGTVAWDAGEVTLTRDEGRAPVAYPGQLLEAVMFADSAATAMFNNGAGETWSLGQVVGVRAGEATSLKIAAGVQEFGEGESPALARAVVRGADGEMLLGLPVTWSVRDGALGLDPGEDLPGQYYVYLADACVAPERRGGARSAVIVAEYGELAASLELRWDGVAEPADPTWTPDDTCSQRSGCAGCRAEGGGSWGALVLLVLGWRRVARRRRR